MTAMPVDERSPGRRRPQLAAVPTRPGAVRRAWTPWLILSVFVFLWGTPQVRASLDGVWVAKVPVAGLARARAEDAARRCRAAHRERGLQFQSAVGDRHRHFARGHHLRALLSATGLRGLLRMYGRTLYLVRYSLLTISCMMAIGFVTRYSGTDATLGLALASTGWLYPLLRHADRLARRGAHRLGYVVERAVRRPAAGHGRATRPQPGADGGGQQLGRRDGQDDRRAVDRRRLDGDQVVRPRRLHSALRLLPLDRARVLVGLLVMGQAYVWPFTLLAP